MANVFYYEQVHGIPYNNADSAQRVATAKAAEPALHIKQQPHTAICTAGADVFCLQRHGDDSVCIFGGKCKYKQQ